MSPAGEPSARAATVVFTDLAESTALAARLGPEGAEDLRKIHFSLLRDAIDTGGGREVKTLGDGFMVEFPGVGAALDSTVAMQQAIDHHNRRDGAEPMQIRVGISTGDVTEENGDLFGEPVVEAARLCARCADGQILATDLVAALGRRSEHVFVEVGELELKGLPDPVRAVEVAWAPGERSATPLPARLAGDGLVIGRDTEIATMDTALKDARADGRRRIVLVSGEPGMGKTTLASTFARSAHAQGLPVLYGRCDEDLGVPYQPWIEALDHLVAHARDGVLDSLEARQLGDLSRLLRSVQQRRPGLGPVHAGDPESERYLFYGAVSALLTAAGNEDPVIVVLDDLHWADKPTVELLRFLDVDTPALVVATFRDSDVSDKHPLADTLAALHRDGGVERLALEGLDDAEVIRLFEAVAGHDMDQGGVALAHAVRAETDGNPFFTRELVRHLAETGTIYQGESGRWVASADFDPRQLPVSVREVVGHRVARLGDAARQALQAAAVIGRDFDLSVLAGVLDLDEDGVLDVLEQAVANALVAEAEDAVGRFTFVHALIQHTLYADVSPTRRAKTHRRVAETLERLGSVDDHLGELAHHWGAAVTPTDAGKAIEYARRAGEQALDQLAPDEAIRWYSQGLELAAEHGVDERVRAEMLVGLGDAQRQIGESGFIDTLVEAGALARRLGDGELLAQAALATNRGFWATLGRVTQPVLDLIEAALDASGGSVSRDRARLLGLLAQELHHHPDQSRLSDVADQALDVARRLDDQATLLYCLLRAWTALSYVGWVERRRPYALEARELGESSGSPVDRFWAWCIVSSDALEAGDRDGFDRSTQEMRRIVEAIGQPSLLWRMGWNDTIAAQLDCDHDRVERRLTEDLEVGTAAGSSADALVVYSGQLCVARWYQGRYVELVDLIEQAAADNPWFPAFRGTLALAHADSGNLDAAADLVRRELTTTHFDLPRDVVYSLGLGLWSDASVLVEDADACAVLYDLLAPYPGLLAMTSTLFHCGTDHLLGALARVLGRHDLAEEHLAAAHAFDERLRAPFFSARTHLERARNFHARGWPDDTDKVAEHASAALDLARTHGLAAVERRASEFMDSIA